MERTLVLIPGAGRDVDAHLSVDDVAGMVDGRLPADRRALVEAHLAVCSLCRTEVAQASSIVGSLPARSRIPVRWIAGVAAAVLVVAIVPLVRSTRDVAVPKGERASPGHPETLTALAPTADAQMPADSLKFAWRSVSGVTTYHLFVTDSVGAPVYDVATAETTVVSNGIPQLSPGVRYFWRVDALSSDGSTVNSPSIGFSIRAR